jgi:hypothetical protein
MSKLEDINNERSSPPLKKPNPPNILPHKLVNSSKSYLQILLLMIIIS